MPPCVSRLAFGCTTVFIILIVLDWMVSTFIAMLLKFAGAVEWGVEITVICLNLALLKKLLS